MSGSLEASWSLARSSHNQETGQFMPCQSLPLNQRHGVTQEVPSEVRRRWELGMSGRAEHRGCEFIFCTGKVKVGCKSVVKESKENDLMQNREPQSFSVSSLLNLYR